MSSLTLKDDRARRSITEELDVCLLVEAGAGSGKTKSLVDRMVALIKSGRCTVSGLAAVTFTRKAAAELRGRFQLALERARKEEADPIVRTMLDDALAHLDRCFLGTIHSFCATLLRERPVEAGLDPGFSEADEIEDRILRDACWEEYLASVQSRPELLEQILNVGVRPRALKDFYAALATYPEVQVVREVIPAPDLGQARVELQRLLEMAENVLPAKRPAAGWDGLQSLLRRALRRHRFIAGSDVSFLELLELFESGGKVTQNRWSSKDQALEMRDAAEAFREKVVSPVMQKWREHRHSRLTEFVLPAVELYGRRRLERSRLNYQDLLLSAAGLLRDNAEVRRYFQERFTHLLVDEFQDTDPVQAEIMFYLAGSETGEKDWRKLTPRPGSLFVVGDPKQAIYRFRRADIETYNEAKELIAASGGKVLRLTTNFRSVGAIGTWVDGVFKDLMPAEATSFHAAFTAFDTVRPDEASTTYGLRKITLPKVNRDAQAGMVALDARRIARWIRWALDGGIALARAEEEKIAGRTERAEPGDFLIIVRYKSYIAEYARQLETFGIPYHLSGGAGLADSEELAGVLKVLRAITDADDPVALVAVLRSELFGISDNQLWLFKRAGGRFNFQSPVPAALADGDRDLFALAFTKLKTFHGWSRKLPASVAVEKIFLDLGVVPAALTAELGRSKAGNLVQALELAATAERSGLTSFASLVDYLAGLAGQMVEEELDIAARQGDAVRIMNLHKAKGLESPVVFLANPGKQVTHPPELHIDRLGSGPSGYFLVQDSGKLLAQPQGWADIARKEQQFLAAEETRLLYVASTRVKGLLVVSTYPDNPAKSPWQPLNKYLVDVPELDDPQVMAVNVPDQAGRVVTKADLDQARIGFLSPAALVNIPTYAAVSVTSLVKEKEDSPARQATGRGMSWGTVVHRVLEACARRMPGELGLLVEKVLVEEGRDPRERDAALGLVHGVRESALWQRMERSKKVFTELPFSLAVDGKEYGQKGDTVLSGVIDMVFEEDDRWVIVDYKTDTIESDDELRALVEYYGPQVKMYGKFLSDLSNIPISEIVLYFTYRQQIVKINTKPDTFP